MADEAASLVIKISGDASELEAAIKGVEKQLNKLESSGSVLEKQTKPVKAAEAAHVSYGKQLQKSGKHLQEIGDSIDDVTKPLRTSAVALAAGGVAVAKFAIDFEDNFAAVKKTVEGTPEDLEKVKQGIIDLSTVGIDGRSPLPMTTAELTELAAAGGQLGISTENIVEFTEVMAQMGTATNLAGQEGAAAMARFRNVMQIPEEEIRNMGSAIVDLGNNMATTEAEIITMANRMGKYGNTVGMGAADVLGYSAALSSLGVEAQLGGSAVGRTWLAIETAVASGGKELQAFAKYAGKSAKDFKKQWNTDASGAFSGLLKGLGEAENLTLALSEVGINNTQDIQAIMSMATNYELVAGALERANTAYKENTALQKEADAKNETTASKIQVMTNNLVEAGRSIGEIFIPAISDAALDVSQFAQKIAVLDDGAKKTIVNIGATVIGLGAASKGVASTIKTIGTIKEGWGKLAAMSPAIAKIGPAIASGITSPVGLATLAVAGLGIAAKKAYDVWYDSEYRWSEGLSAGNEKIKESLDGYKQISDIKNQIKDLKLIIENPESSKEQITTAQKKLEEIKELLSEEYNLVIHSDNSNLDDAVEQVSQIKGDELQTKINEQMSKLSELRDKIVSYEGDYEKDYSEYEKYLADQTKYGKLKNDISALDAEYRRGNITLSERNERVKELAEAEGLAEAAAKGYGFVCQSVNKGYAYAEQQVKKYKDRLDDLTTAQEEYSKVATEIANWETDLLKLSALEGDAEGVERALNNIGAVVKDANLDANEYAQAAALAMQGIASLEQVWEQASNGDSEALNNTVDDYIRAMQAFGASAQDTAVGAALIKNGFKSIDDAVSAGKLDIISQQATELAHSLNLIPESSRIVVTAEGKIEVVELKEAIDDVEDKEVSVEATTSGKDDVEDLADSINKVQGKQVIISAITSNLPKGKSVYFEADGTDYFPGGLAMVNDQKGVADPRELIIDNGKAFIPNGRDVILPLSKGAKVYTAAQTKEIMKGLGIPRYASGKDNSDAFISARDSYSHYTKTHAVTVSEELAKWVEFSKQFKGNIKDVEDIEEQIYSLTVKQNKELNEISSEYIQLHSQLNDWGVVGDDPVSAFNRVKERNLAEVNAGRMTWDEYDTTMTKLADDMLDARIDQSEDWLDRQRELYGMDTKAYIEGIDRMLAYSYEYYEALGVSAEKYHEVFTKLADERMKAEKELAEEAVSSWEKSADNWYKIRETYGDWAEVNDSKTEYYLRRLANYEQLYRSGDLGWEEYMDKSMEDYLNLYEAEEERIDTELDEFRKIIDETETKFREEEQALRDSWTVEDRQEELDEVNRLLGIYENAVTDSGQQKYKDLLEQKKQLEREEQLYELEQEHNEELEELEAEYQDMEKQKEKYLKQLRGETGNIYSGVKTLNSTMLGTQQLSKDMANYMISASKGNFQLMEDLVKVLEKLAKKTGTTYNNNGTYNIADSRDLIETLTGTVVSGLGGVLIN